MRTIDEVEKDIQTLKRKDQDLKDEVKADIDNGNNEDYTYKEFRAMLNLGIENALAMDKLEFEKAEILREWRNYHSWN